MVKPIEFKCGPCEFGATAHLLTTSATCDVRTADTTMNRDAMNRGHDVSSFNRGKTSLSVRNHQSMTDTETNRNRGRGNVDGLRGETVDATIRQSTSF